jgi:hypothetical protein
VRLAAAELCRSAKEGSVAERSVYVAAYAVIRIDDGPLDHPSSVGEFVLDGVPVPAPGPSNVRVKEIVTTAEEARREVVRLNQLNAGKACRYFWQATHVFLDGGSHGSTGRAAGEVKDAEQGAPADGEV